jgi:hypothetical protein
VADQKVLSIRCEAQAIRPVGHWYAKEGAQIGRVQESNLVRAQFGHRQETTIGSDSHAHRAILEGDFGNNALGRQVNGRQGVGSLVAHVGQTVIAGHGNAYRLNPNGNLR